MPDEPIIPPKEHVYLDGPKSRGYELGFCNKGIYGNF